MLFGIAAVRLAPSASQIMNGISTIRSSINGMEILYNNINDINKLSSLSNSRLNHTSSEQKINFKTLRLNGVSFSHNDSSKKTIENIDLEINSGDIIGIMGPSGSGKTTLVDVILGLLKVSSGSIKFNDLNLEEELQSWQGQIAYLPQEVFILDQTLKQNITLTLNDCDIDDKKLEQSIRMAKLEVLVDELPKGMNTIIGEKGIRMSGGQRQRIALARSFYFERKVLIFDEATSALDSETEKEIMNEISQLKGIKTIILIAHRVSTLHICNKVYKLEKGKIINSGTYQEVVGSNK
jgi:ABC-type bacteriocin/lantibiotic exporter with double-glycine peptidase domain